MTKSQGRSAEKHTQTPVGNNGGQRNNALVPDLNTPVPENVPVPNVNSRALDLDVPVPNNPQVPNVNAPVLNCDVSGLNDIMPGLQEYVEVIKELIENNLRLYVTIDEMAYILKRDRSIPPEATKLVWSNLEKSNPEYFRAYNTMLALSRQITKFNTLLEKQASLAGLLQGAPAESLASNFPAPPAVGTSGYKSENLGGPEQPVGNIARTNNNSPGNGMRSSAEDRDLQALLPERDSTAPADG